MNEVIERTPLEIKPRKSLQEQSLFAAEKTHPIQPTLIKIDEPPELLNFYEQNIQNLPLTIGSGDKDKLKLTLTTCLEPHLKPSASNSELDESVTPDDCNLELANVNYDIDFSDLSTENSVVEELSIDKRKSPSITPDPFSPVGSYCNISQPPLIPCNYTDSAQTNKEFVLPFLESKEPDSLLDGDLEEQKLQSPLVPSSSYSGFSKQGHQIPSIPCSTGDYNSLNLLQSDLPSTSTTDSQQKRQQRDDKIVNVLEGVLGTFDKLF